MTAKEALQEAQDELELEWTSNTEPESVVGLVAELVEELATPLAALQTVQVLWLPVEAASRKKPVAKRILDKLKHAAPMLAQGDHALAWAQALAWAALRAGLEGNSSFQTAKLITMMRSAIEWCETDKRQHNLCRKLLTEAQNACRMPVLPRHQPYQIFGGWPNAEIEQAKEPNPYTSIKSALDGWGNSPQNIVNAVSSLNSLASTEIDSNREAAEKVIQHIETHLVQPLAAPAYVTEPLEILWWGQSLYSLSLHESYRDLSTPEKLFWMAEDMAQLPSAYPSEARTAFFTETLRRVQDEIDKPVVLKDLVQHLIQGVHAGLARDSKPTALEVPKPFADAFEKDPTGLPITFIVEGARRKMSEQAILDELPSKVGIDLTKEKSTRQWARWVCRERLLVRFLHELNSLVKG